MSHSENKIKILYMIFKLTFNRAPGWLRRLSARLLFSTRVMISGSRDRALAPHLAGSPREDILSPFPSAPFSLSLSLSQK